MSGRSPWKEGLPHALGATYDGKGVNFALFSANADKVELCLFDPGGTHETARLAMPERAGDIWYGYLRDAHPGLLYGYRVQGPYDPLNGHRFNPNKLLIDPYARALTHAFEWNDVHCGYDVSDSRADLSFDMRDNAALMPKCIVVDQSLFTGNNSRPQIPATRSVIYELHVRGYTMLHPAVEMATRGTVAALGHSDVIRHLRDLGVTAVELMPVHPIAMTRALAQNGLRDYWGYNSINFFAIEPRYLAHGRIDEFRHTVKKFHDAGIEVILDVVFNHTGEGDELGPTLSFRGIDNASYYCLAEDKRRYVDFSGCKNSLNLEHPRVLQMVMDSLRYWAVQMSVDGFRFDLAPSLAREHHHFSPQGRFFATVMQDPVLSKMKLIAEPWDLGPDGYQLGNFPPGWSEWNDRYRDGVRRFWRGDNGTVSELAHRLAGSSDLFDGRNRGPAASVNFVTAHDGFTLEDLVSYEAKHNTDNGEANRDGPDTNYSWNCSMEGPSDNIAVRELRERQKRNMMATLLLSQGVPMLVAGDEFGRTQRGNNNAYCQDNEASWIDWSGLEENAAFFKFVQRLLDLRAKYRTFRRSHFFEGAQTDRHGLKDIAWLSPLGLELTMEDWHSGERRFLGVRYAASSVDQPVVDQSEQCAFLLLANAGADEVRFKLPGARPHARWTRVIDTASHGPTAGLLAPGEPVIVAAHSLCLLSEEGCGSSP